MKDQHQLLGLLSGIGLSGLESAVYLALSREPGATGYRLAQMTGKLAANVYKALDSLRTKGIVLPDDSSGSRTYVALPIREYLNRRRRELDNQQAAIERELADLPVDQTEQGVYKLTGVDQVYERCRAMIAEAKSVVLLDAFPHPLALLKKTVTATSKRGVDVLIKAYEPTRITGCEVLAPDGPEPQLRVWDGDWLNLVVDSGESVQALLKKDDAGVHAAAWCRNRYLAMLDYNGMASEFVLTRIMYLLQTGAERPAIKRELKRMLGRYFRYETYLRQAPDSWLTAWRPEKKPRKR